MQIKSAYDVKFGTRGKWVVRPERKDYIRNLATKLVTGQNYSQELELLELKESVVKENQNIIVLEPIEPTGPAAQTGQSVIFWNKDPSAADIILSYQHAGTDSVDKLCLALILNCSYKCLVVNRLYKGVTTKQSPYAEKRTEADACHSPVPLNLSFMDKLVNGYHYALLSMHGCNPKVDYKIWFLNSLGAKGGSVAYESIQLCLLNSAIKTFGNKYTFMTNIRQVSGKKVNFGSSVQYLAGPTTDVPMHIVNAAGITDKIGSETGRSCHMENDITFSVKQLDSIIKMHQNAIDDYLFRNKLSSTIQKKKQNLTL